MKDLHVRIGELGPANEFWPVSSNPGPASEAQDDKTKPAEPVRRQAMPLLPISRSSFYREPKGEVEMNLELVRVIDRQFHETSPEIRMRLSARLGYRIRGQGRDQEMVRALQPQAPHSALGGKPSAVVYWFRNPTTTPDLQQQRGA